MYFSKPNKIIIEKNKESAYRLLTQEYAAVKNTRGQLSFLTVLDRDGNENRIIFRPEEEVPTRFLPRATDMELNPDYEALMAELKADKVEKVIGISDLRMLKKEDTISDTRAMILNWMKHACSTNHLFITDWFFVSHDDGEDNVESVRESDETFRQILGTGDLDNFAF